MMRWVCSVAVVAAALGGMTGCGGGDDSAAPTTAPSSTSATSTPTTSSTTSAIASSDDAEIAAAFVAFFDGSNPDTPSRVAVLEHGDALAAMLAAAAADPQFAQMSTQVRSVRLLDAATCATAGVAAPCAEVIHDVLVGQFPAVPAKTSYAVQLDGVWKVSAKAWCDVVSIGGASCPQL